MSDFGLKDVRVLEEDEDASADDVCLSLQRAINSGTAWSLQGSYGRSMMAAINNGDCMLGPKDARDYYGNRIPSRDQVQSGTKGSRQYVVDRRGEEWAKTLEAV